MTDDIVNSDHHETTFYGGWDDPAKLHDIDHIWLLHPHEHSFYMSVGFLVDRFYSHIDCNGIWHLHALISYVLKDTFAMMIQNHIFRIGILHLHALPFGVY